MSKNQKDAAEKKLRTSKKVDYEGSRWNSLILLVITILASLFFYFTGQR